MVIHRISHESLFDGCVCVWYKDRSGAYAAGSREPN